MPTKNKPTLESPLPTASEQSSTASEQSSTASEQSSTVSKHFTRNTDARNTDPVNLPRQVVDLHIRQVYPSPFNPRKRFDEAALQELAEDIAADGVLQPITVRPLALTPAQEVVCSGEAQYEIVMGERRFRASVLAGLKTIPALIREMDDRRLTREALKENIQRQDLTPMEAARGYQSCLDTGSTQQEMADSVGVSQSRIANLTRLLDLPEDVQQMIEEGKLTAGHGIQLCRYKDFPALCRLMAEQTFKNSWPVKTLEAGLTYTNTGLAMQEGVIVCLSAYSTRAVFDWKTVCAACPFGAFRSSVSTTGDAYSFCLNPSHFEALQKEAREEKKAREDAEAIKLRDQAVQRSRDAQEKLAAAATNKAKENAEAEVRQTGAVLSAVTDKSVVSTGGFPPLCYGKIERVNRFCPAVCREGNCPCSVQARDEGSSDVVPACADPKRKAALEAAAKKEANKDRRTAFDEAREKVAALPWDNLATETQGRRMMAMVAWSFLRNCKGEVKKQVAARISAAGELGQVRALLLRTAYEVLEADAWTILSAASPTDLLGITAEAMLRDDLLARYDYGDTDLAKTRALWFLAPPDVPAFATGDSVEVHYEDKWLAASVIAPDDPPSLMVWVLAKGDSGPMLFGPEAIRAVRTVPQETIHA